MCVCTCSVEAHLRIENERIWVISFILFYHNLNLYLNYILKLLSNFCIDLCKFFIGLTTLLEKYYFYHHHRHHYHYQNALRAVVFMTSSPSVFIIHRSRQVYILRLYLARWITRARSGVAVYWIKTFMLSFLLLQQCPACFLCRGLFMSCQVSGCTAVVFWYVDSRICLK